MTLLPTEPTPELTTDRVRAGRRAALTVALAALIVVGTLVWKPWDTGPGAPATIPPGHSVPAVAVASPAPPATPITTPAIAPPAEIGPAPVNAPDDLGSVGLATTLDDAFVYCVYGGAVGDQPGLTTMFVSPPFVLASRTARSLVKNVDYRPEVEVNQLQGVFSAEWSFLLAGRSQSSRLTGLVGPSFKQTQIKVSVGQLPPSAVLRVAVVINWIGTNGKRLATQRLYPASYAPLGAPSGGTVPEGCPARN